MKRRILIVLAVISLASLAILLVYFFRPRLIPRQNHELSQIPTVTPTPLPGNLTVLRGTALLVRQGKPQNLISAETTALASGDTVTTKEDSLAVINYGQGTVARLGSETSVDIPEASGSATSLRQIVGSLYVRFRKILGLREQFRLTTPTALATVRGTKFASFVKKSGLTKIVAVEDTVNVASIDGFIGEDQPGPGEDVSAGDQAEILPEPKSTKKISISQVKLEPKEASWLKFNEQADELPDDSQATSSLSAQLLSSPTPTPTPSPTPVPTKPPLPAIGSMPGDGYSRSLVKTEVGDFTLTCVGATKGSVHVVTDSANEADCLDNCPVMPLQEYATRNGGFAAMNGMYFCPPDYPQCTGKVNTFDTLFFNSRVQRYINSDQNGASVVPFLGINSSGNPVFERESRNWPRDTGIQAGTAGNPLLVLGTGNVVGDYSLDDKQRSVKSNRGAFVEEGDKIYLCVSSGATVPDSAKIYQTLGVDNAINIDGGGSSALWFNGSYVYGPGRSLPTSIIFVRN